MNVTADKIEELDYFNLFIKEILWIDPPVFTNFNQAAYEDVTVDGIKFLKGADIWYNIIGVHYNKDQWQSPEEFIPERFDPSSKFYKKPNGEMRSKLAYIPFTFGAWACPGQFLALIAIKIHLLFAIKNKCWTWNINMEELERNKFVTFSLTAKTTLTCKVQK